MRRLSADVPSGFAGATNSALPRVAVFCPELFLPYSQTFIFDELRMHTRYDPDVFAVGAKCGSQFQHPRLHTPGNLSNVLMYLATSRCTGFDQVFRARRPRVVHAHFGTAGVFAYPYARRYDLPLVVTFHGYDVAILNGRGRLMPHRWRYWAMSKPILRYASALLCASLEMCDLISKLSERPAAVRLYRLGVDVQRYYRSVEDRPIPRVTMIGRFVEKKGHIYGIEAFARALDKYPATLSIVGAGPLEARYRSTIARLGIESAVTFHGVLTTSQIADLLSRTDVLLAPSCLAPNGDRESGLLVVREAGAASVPVIGTFHGGIPESIDDGRTGYLVAERDVGEMALRLIELLTEPARRQQMGLAARAKVMAEFDLVARVEELADIYDQVTGQTPKAPGECLR